MKHATVISIKKPYVTLSEKTVDQQQHEEVKEGKTIRFHNDHTDQHVSDPINKQNICYLLQMDELFSPEEIKILEQSTHRRSSTKCYRCKHKRLPCNYQFPKCDSCLKENIECNAWVRGLNKPIPRSIPLYLEDKVANLEIELDKLKNHHVINNAEEESYTITKYVSTPLLQSFINSENESTIQSFSFLYFNSCNLPAPFDNMIEGSKRGKMKHFIENHPPVDLLTIPKNVVKIMMSNYMDFHLPQYPIISRPMLTEMLETVLNKPEIASLFEKAVISITMAISAALITNRSEKRALSSSSALFSATISTIFETSWENKMQKLQLTLLIAHYSFANPFAADIWHTLRDALRLCIDMGLHKEVTSEVITVLDVDDRRRLFLVCSGMLRHLSAVLRIKFPIHQNLISVEYPTIVDDSFITEKGIDYSGPQTKAAALHFYSFRLCESEVCDVLWYDKEINVNINDWIDSMEEKVENWFITAEEFAKVNQLRFRLICKASLQIRLRRRTPRIPNPSHESFLKLIKAVLIHVDEYLNDAKSAQVSYLLMGVHYIVEAAINLLDVLWFEIDWIKEFYSFEFLINKLGECIELLNKFSERWPDIKESNIPNYLENLKNDVIKKNDGLLNDDECNIISSKIEKLIFPTKIISKVSDDKKNDIVDNKVDVNNDKNQSSDNNIINNNNESDILNFDNQNQLEEMGKYEHESLSDALFSDKSNWQDHFIDDNFWDLNDLLNKMCDYI